MSTGQYTGGFQAPTLSGVAVNDWTALTISSVWSAVQKYIGTLTTLDLYIAEKLDDGGHARATWYDTSRLVSRKPNRQATRARWWAGILGHTLTGGNGYAEIIRRNGRPSEFQLMDPRNVRPEFDPWTGQLWYRLTREAKSLPARNVLHLAYPMTWDGTRGYSPVYMAREALGIGIAQEQYQGALIGNGAIPQGYLEVPGKLKQDTESRLLDNWNAVHQGTSRAGKVGILGGGMKWVATSFTPEDAQILLSRRFTVEEVARIWNLPPFMLGVEGATAGNVEQQMLSFSRVSLPPWLTMIEQELGDKVIEPEDQDDYFVVHDLKGLTRGDQAAQAAADQADFKMGALSPNERRLSQGKNPIASPNGDKHYIEANNYAALEDLTTVNPDEAAKAQKIKIVGDEKVEKPDAGTPDNVQATALNGAQISSLLTIVQNIQAGTVPVDSAKGLIAASFPDLSPAEIDAIIGSVQPHADPMPNPMSKPDAREAVRAMLADPVSRMIRVECSAVRRACKQERFDLWVDKFYEKHAQMNMDAITPALQAARALGSVPQQLRRPFDWHGRRSLLALVTTTPPDEMPAAVDKLCTEWEATRVDQIVDELMGVSQ
jgi:HK97 family phage portal protein